MNARNKSHDLVHEFKEVKKTEIYVSYEGFVGTSSRDLFEEHLLLI